MSLAACMRCWPATIRSPWVLNSLASEELLQHRCLCLLELQEEGVVVVTPHHQQHPGAGSDAADPDDFARQVDVAVLVEQSLSVGAQ